MREFKNPMEDYYSSNELLAMYNVFGIISNTEDFKNWLRTRNIRVSQRLFDGYKFFIMMTLGCITQSFIHNRNIGLNENVEFQRAVSVGIPLMDIPNTCEKAIFIKNIWNLTQTVREAHNWKEHSEGLAQLDDLMSMLETIYRNSESGKEEFSKELSLNLVTQFFVLAEYNSIRGGKPVGSGFYFTYAQEFDDEHIENIYSGYVYSLQFVWFNLLGEKEYDESCIKYLDCPSEYFNDLIENKKVRGKQQIRYKWGILDRFFDEINRTIVHGGYSDLLKIGPIDKAIFDQYLSSTCLNEPSYLIHNDLESLFKRLDYYLLWYDLDFLDTQGNYDFNGKLAFIRMLLGSIELYKEYNYDDRIHVTIFKHGSKDHDGYDYSFCVLIEQIGLIRGDTGWIIFFDNAYDYTSSGTHDLDLICKFIEDNKNELSINVHEIDKNVFKKYLDKQTSDRSLNVTFEDEISKEEEEQLKKTISSGENLYVELKSSIRGTAQQKEKSEFGYPIAKSIAGLLNAYGGRLIIGVDNNKNIIGIEQGYMGSTAQQNRDTFISDLTNVINKFLSKECYTYIKTKVIPVEGKSVCIIDISKGDIPFFLKSKYQKEFFVRFSETTQPLDVEESYQYIGGHYNRLK